MTNATMTSPRATLAAALTMALGLVVAAALALFGLPMDKPAHANTFTYEGNLHEGTITRDDSTTFVVNTRGDGGDESPGNGSCSTGGSIARGDGETEMECTLRAAIQEANASPAADTINFDIPGPVGPHTISPITALPVITHPLTIDGYSQGRTTELFPFDDAKENTLTKGTNAVLKIELNGQGKWFPGLEIKASNCVVRGLAINSFSSGITIASGASNTKIEGNFIGSDPSGTTKRGNSMGLYVGGGSSKNVIGGTAPAARNIISGNYDTGVYAPISSTPGSTSGGNVIQGNLIGTQKDGTSALGNGGIGVLISSSHNTIGDNAPGAPNTIAYNGSLYANSPGVSVQGSVLSNRILRNSIFSNSGLGIDLEDLSPTPNDLRDPDTGPNTLQNFPGISSAVTASGGPTTIKGRLNSIPNRTFTIQFFSSPAPDPSGYGEGKIFIGQRSVTTNDNGDASFTFTPKQPVPVSWRVTATATDGGGNTSEFSKARIVVRPPAS